MVLFPLSVSVSVSASASPSPACAQADARQKRRRRTSSSGRGGLRLTAVADAPPPLLPHGSLLLAFLLTRVTLNSRRRAANHLHACECLVSAEGCKGATNASQASGHSCARQKPSGRRRGAGTTKPAASDAVARRTQAEAAKPPLIGKKLAPAVAPNVRSLGVEPEDLTRATVTWAPFRACRKEKVVGGAEHWLTRRAAQLVADVRVSMLSLWL